MVSKQPSFKYAAVKVAKAGSESLVAKVVGAASQVMDRASELADAVMGGTHPTERSHVSDYLGFLSDANEEFAAACDDVSEPARAERRDPRGGRRSSATSPGDAIEELGPFIATYGRQPEKEPRALRQTLFPKPRAGSFGLLRDLHALHVLAADAQVATKIVKDAARELRDEALHDALPPPGRAEPAAAGVGGHHDQGELAQSVVVPLLAGRRDRRPRSVSSPPGGRTGPMSAPVPPPLGMRLAYV